jgi:hypothetical protein
MPEPGGEATKCACCGAVVDGLWDVLIPLPDAVAAIPVAERAKRFRQFGDEAGVLDRKHCFVRANLEIPIRGRAAPWAVTGWGSLSKENFERMLDRWDDPARTELGALFSWFCNGLRGFEPLVPLKSDMIVRPVGQRPALRLHDGDHPLVAAQRGGLEAHVALDHARRLTRAPDRA